MNSPPRNAFRPYLAFSQLLKPYFLAPLILILLSSGGCGGKIVKVIEAEPKPRETTINTARTAVWMWLGNPSRTFYGTGPLTDTRRVTAQSHHQRLLAIVLS